MFTINRSLVYDKRKANKQNILSWFSLRNLLQYTNYSYKNYGKLLYWIV